MRYIERHCDGSANESLNESLSESMNDLVSGVSAVSDVTTNSSDTEPSNTAPSHFIKKQSFRLIKKIHNIAFAADDPSSLFDFDN